MSIDHLPWRGPDYHLGIDGARIAIAGYSHHRLEAQADHPAFTIDTVGGFVADPRHEHSFFSYIRSYFGEENCSKFWNRVLFFNVLPDCIGTTEGGSDHRFDLGTPEQGARAKPRFLDILREHAPDKVLVFSAKAWRTVPRTIEEERGSACPALGDVFPSFARGTYSVGGKVIDAFGLRHPQGAAWEEMKEAVDWIMERDGMLKAA